MKKVLFLLSLAAVAGVFYMSGEKIKFMDYLTLWSGSELSLATVSQYEFFIRKSLHMISYFTICLLFFLFLYSFGSLKKTALILAPLSALALALADELNQATTAGRTGVLADVFIDGMGIVIALIIILFALTLRRL